MDATLALESTRRVGFWDALKKSSQGVDLSRGSQSKFLIEKIYRQRQSNQLLGVQSIHRAGSGVRMCFRTFGFPVLRVRLSNF